MGAWAQSAPVAPDVSVSSVGVQTWTDTAIRGIADTPQTPAPSPTDMDVVVGERLRWTVAGDRLEPGTDVVALVDARFTIDAGPEETHRLEWSAVRQAGFEFVLDQWTIDIGRHPVYRGGPRLVDGLQALYAPSPTVRVGVWGGLAPNLFTTLPELRPGGGPIVSYATSQVQASLVGDIVTFDGAVDRVGFLGQGRVSFERRLDLSARLDVEAVGPVGPRLVDGQVVAIGNPTPSVRIDVMYDGFSSFRYVDPTDLDPDTQRFVDRLSDLGLAPLVPYEQANPTLNHLVGGGFRFEPDTNDAAPRLALLARYRTGPPFQGSLTPTQPTQPVPTAPVGTTPVATGDPAAVEPDLNNTFLRVNPQAGVVRLGGMLDLLADANLIWIDGGQQIDGGLTFWVEPDDSPVAIDGSARILLAETEVAPFGWYGDLFLNLVSPDLDLLLIAGGMVSSEPDVIDEQPDLGVGAFVRIAKYVRPPRR